MLRRIAHYVAIRLARVTTALLLPLYVAALHPLRAMLLRTQGVVVVVPAMEGSLGDEAMVAALAGYLRKQRIPMRLLVTLGRQESWPTVDRSVRRVSMHSFFAGSHDLEVFGVLLHASMALDAVLIGADVLDGGYSTLRSMQRLRLCKMFSKVGLRTRICSFSWSDAANPECVAALAALPSDVQLFPRDPCSYHRVTGISSASTKLTADLAFQLTPRCDAARHSIERELTDRKNRGQVLVGININHTLLSRLASGTVEELVGAYGTALGRLAKNVSHIHFVGVPHDNRAKIDDYSLLTRVAQQVNTDVEQMTVLPGDMTAAEVKYFAKWLDVLHTARMHAAIAALGQGVPVSGIAYQGKWEGLFQHFEFDAKPLGIDALTSPDVLYDDLLRLVNERNVLSAQISKRLPEVLALSQSALEGLSA